MLVHLAKLTKVAAICGLTFACGLSAPTEASAQGTKAAAKKSFENRTLTTKDNLALKCTYFPSPEMSKESPVVVLLHGRGGNRLIWQTGAGQYPGFAQALQQKGYAVLTVDLRHHGETLSSSEGAAANKKTDQVKLKPADYQAMVAFDLEAVKKFLLEEHQKEKLNIGKLAIIGADITTAVALAYTELDWSKEPYDDAPTAALRTPRGQDVKALVLLSPETSVPGLKTNGGVTLIKQLKMNVMLGVGNKDTLDKGTAKKLADQLDPMHDAKETTDKVKYVFLETYETKFRGTDLLVKEGFRVEAQMLKFLDDHIRKLEVPWRTRKSNLAD